MKQKKQMPQKQLLIIYLIDMKKKPVLFLDSGIGGIPYCKCFHQRNPGESIIYFADRLNFPYGKKEKGQLIEILTNLLENLIKTLNPKIMVLACNTASIASLSALRKSFPLLPIIGTVPAVKPAAIKSKTGKIGVLGTELTINEPYIRELAAKYGNAEIAGIAAPELVEFIENKITLSTDAEKKEIVNHYLKSFRKEGVDALVLGCTHFLFLQEFFQNEAKPDISVFDSLEGITRRIETALDEHSLWENKAHNAENYLLLSAETEPEAEWIGWADYLNFKISLIKDYE